MENQFQIFQHEEFGKVRTLVIDGEIYFVGKDVATALGYSNASKAILMHVDEEDKKIFNRKDFEEMASNKEVPKMGIPYSTNDFFDDSTMGGVQRITIINESGLYSLILSSKLPDAKKFKRWVTSEVLPSIRKTGSYSLPKVENAVAVQNSLPILKSTIAAIALKDAVSIKKNMVEEFGVKAGIAGAVIISMVERLDGVELTELKGLLPPAEHEIGIYTPTQIGKKIGKSAQYVNKKLVELGLQEKDSNGYKLTEKGKEYAEAMPFERNGHTGYQIKWTAEILKFFE